MGSLIEVICGAINEQKLLEFSYRSLLRVVEPMCLGEVKRGEWQLRAHQVGGKSSSSPRLPDGKPKMFVLSEILDVAVRSESFEVPVFYRRSDTGFIKIIAQL